MYEAKTWDRNRLRSLTLRCAPSWIARLELERDLRSALEREELELRYQPIVAKSARRGVGFEAHLHWDHARRRRAAQGASAAGRAVRA